MSDKEKPIDWKDERVWNAHANRLARDFAPPVKTCRDCAAPVLEGYCCRYCKSVNP